LPARRDILVLCYHAISPTWPAELATSPAEFERQLKLLMSRGYRGATFTEAVAQAPHDRTLVVTFDDAYRSTLTLGKPVLDRLGLPGTVFVPTAYPGGGPMVWPGIDMWAGGPHEHELVPMSWDELGGLSAAGWEIGSHTVSHPRLTACTDERLRTELVDSRRACVDALGIPCRSLAYPYGDLDARVVQAAGEAGYHAGAALPARWHAADPLQWPRVGVYGIDVPWRFALKVSPAVRRLRTLVGR
jgi:peptidoglycan/xylan/chitin deacetylase (PgdA/CDA1 family)